MRRSCGRAGIDPPMGKVSLFSAGRHDRHARPLCHAVLFLEGFPARHHLRSLHAPVDARPLLFELAVRVVCVFLLRRSLLGTLHMLCMHKQPP